MSFINDNLTTKGFAVTPHASTDLAFPAKVLYVKTGGTLVVVGMDNVAVDMGTVASGFVMNWMQIKRVNAVGTTADGILAFA